MERQRLRLVGDKLEEKEPWMDFSFFLENNRPEMKFFKFTFIWFPLHGVIENDALRLEVKTSLIISLYSKTELRRES